MITQQLQRKPLVITHSTSKSEINQTFTSGDSGGQINWSKLLFEELSDMMKRKDEELTYLQKRNAKERKDSQKQSISMIKHVNTNPIMNKRKAFNSSTNQFLSIRNMNKAQTFIKRDQSKKNLDEDALLLKHKDFFASSDYTKQTMLNLIRLFFEDAISSNQNNDNQLDYTSMQSKPTEEMDQKELEEFEEVKKKEKMRLDQELIEFKKHGGFAKVLHDLFYNPDVSSLEFDSVYKLKQLCMQYYEKK